jgi:uncharacterized cupin superfamily protein
MSDPSVSPHIIRAAEIEAKQQTFSHPWNPKSSIVGVRLGLLAGLSRCGVGLARIPPGRESFLPHAHHREEEWVYILSGRGMAEINGQEYEAGPGDFIAYPTPNVTHHLRNPFAEELVYLVGGEALSHEIVDFPTVGKRMVRLDNDLTIYDLASGAPFGPLKP